MPKYDAHRAFLNGILKSMKVTRDELIARADDLDSQIKYFEDSITALSAFEYFNGQPSQVVTSDPVISDEELENA